MQKAIGFVHIRKKDPSSFSSARAQEACANTMHIKGLWPKPLEIPLKWACAPSAQSSPTPLHKSMRLKKVG